VSELISERRALCILLASQRPLHLPPPGGASLGVSHIALTSLSADKSLSLLGSLFAHARRRLDADFVESAVRLAGGVPFYLHVLFRSFFETGDPLALPDSLSEFLSERLTQVSEPARSVYDAIVVLGPHCSEVRLARLTELPLYDLLGSIRLLDTAGLIHVVGDVIRPSHDLFASTAIRQMPGGIARLLHRRAALLLEEETSGFVEPLALAAHWEACGEFDRVFETTTRSAADYLRLGRHREAIALLRHGRKSASDQTKQRQIDIALFSAFHAAGDSSEAIVVADALGLINGNEGAELQLHEIDARRRAGQSIVKFQSLLDQHSADRAQDATVRTTAAKLLMILAEDLSDAELGQSVLRNIVDLNDNSFDSIVTALIYETVFGESTRARDLAHRLCDVAVAEKPTVRSIEGLSHAGLALWRNGDCDAGTRLYERVFTLAETEKLWSACVSSASTIAEMCWHAGLIEEADRWIEVARQHAGYMTFPDKSFQYLALVIVRSLEEGDVDTAEETLAHAERLYPGILENRNGLERLAYRLRIDLARGVPLDASQVHDLLSGHMARRDKGLQDVIADTAIAALKSTGRHEEAEALRSEYLSAYRRDGFPPPLALTHLAG
jgi:hypothetical protein